jgi:hypothetical protein
MHSVYRKLFGWLGIFPALQIAKPESLMEEDIPNQCEI